MMYIERLFRIIKFAECPKGTRGRPLSPEGAKKAVAAGQEICDKVTREQRHVQYRTGAGRAAHAKTRAAQQESINKRRAAGEKMRGRKPKIVALIEKARAAQKKPEKLNIDIHEEIKPRLKEIPVEELARSLLWNQDSKIKVSPGLDPSYISLESFTKINDELVYIHRDFDMEEKTVYHSSTEIPKVLQGKGHVKTMLKKILPVYEKMGMKKIVLMANLDVGGYVWAKAGFRISKSGLDRVKRAIVSPSNLVLLKTHEKKLSQMLSKFSTINELANWEISVKDLNEIFPGVDPERLNYNGKTFNGKTIKLGKFFLLGTSWNGEIEIGSPEYEKFKQYIEG